MADAIDAARSAARRRPSGDGHLARARDEMPAHDFEVEEAQHEGISFVPRRGPARVVTADGKVTGIETIGVTSVFDADRRFAPVFDQDDRKVFDADTVILAIGQAIDLDALGAAGPEVSPRRTIQVDNATGATSIPGVWAGGDAAKGPRTLIDAIADGRRSARDIHRHFGGDREEQQTGTLVKLTQFHRLADDYDRHDRVAVPTLDTGRRIGLAEVELGFTEQQARCEAARCLRCFANIILDTNKCVLCALCADVCPVDVISLVPSEEVVPDQPGGTVLLLDEERCIRCGLCIERCPPDALSMGMWKGWGYPHEGDGPRHHRSRGRPSSAIEKARQTTVGKSIFRGPRRVTPRSPPGTGRASCSTCTR
ncbi:MAG: 4Fe-4S binding protein [Ilumatobacteraceae bacterium]